MNKMLKQVIGFSSVILFAFIIIPTVLFAQTNINTIGTFEGQLPSYWKIGNQPGGATLEWANDESRNMGRSLKISKEATAEDAYWESDNMVDFWSQRHYKDVDLKFGVYYKTMNVNTNPANDDEKWWVSYAFYGETGNLIGEKVFELDQSVAATGGWVADTTDVGEIVLPEDSWTTIIKFVGGKNATGTVWADDFVFYGRDGWGGQDWNASVGVPTGWIYWLPPSGGNDGVLSRGYENTIVTDETAHSGLHSLKFDLPFDRETGDAFVGTKRFLLQDMGIEQGDKIRIKVWLKAENLVPDSAAMYPVTWAVGFTYGFFKSNDNNDGFNNVDGYPVDMQFTFPNLTMFDWMPYSIDIDVPHNPEAKCLAVRLHPYARFTGTVYFDDLTVEKLEVPELNAIGSFESDLPSYWHKGNEPGGAMLEWAKDESRNMGRSLKISKEATAEDAYWESDNMVDFWSDRHFKDVDLKFGVYYKTMNVNTNPTNDDEKWWVSYAFYGETGNLIGEKVFELDQSVAATGGWVADTTDVGEIVLPEDSWTTIIKFVGGKNATGTVWADDFVFYGRDGWGGQDWNASVGVPTGWIYWLPPSGGNDGVLSRGYENTIVTDETAHSGLHSLKFDLPFDRETGDAFVGTKRFLLNNEEVNSNAAMANDITALQGIEAGDVLRVSVWVKAENLVPDSAAMYPVTWAVGFTYGFFKSNDNNAGFNNIDGYPIDMQFVFPPVTEFDWTQYYIDIEVPDNPEAKCIAIRLHPYARFTGTVYFDDLKIEKLDIPKMAGIGSFESDLPSYWHKGNEPGGAMLEWAKDESRNMGRSLKISKEATAEDAYWESDNMVDFWSDRHFKDVDLKFGVYYKTMNVNTNPTNDDEKWWVSYAFYGETGNLIGEKVFELDQSVAATGEWVADTTDVGEIVLPDDSWTTIIKFVGGKNATGTVWADDFVFYGRDGWGGQDWNASVGVPTGWIYWLPPSGGNDGVLSRGYENTIVTDETAHSGLHSLKFDLPFDRETGDAFVGTKRFLLRSEEGLEGAQSQPAFPNDISAMQNVNPGDLIRISVWVKAENLVPDSAAMYPVTWAVGFTYGFFKSNDNNAGFNNIDGYPIDMQFVFPEVTSFGWTQYFIDIEVPTDPEAKCLAVRLHPYARFTGTVWFDDLEVKVIGTATGTQIAEKNIPKTYELGNNYPNPFNPSTTIEYALPTAGNVSIEVFNTMGQKVRTLVDAHQPAGRYTVQWDGHDSIGQVAKSGLYFYRMNTGNMYIIRKMMLIK